MSALNAESKRTGSERSSAQEGGAREEDAVVQILGDQNSGETVPTETRRPRNVTMVYLNCDPSICCTTNAINKSALRDVLKKNLVESTQKS
jgi:hypothetical protein